MKSATQPPAPRRRTAGGQPPRLRLRVPGDLLDAIPFLLGFHPLDSLVVVGVRGPRQRVGLSMRADLPPPQDDEGVAELAGQVCKAMVADRVETCFLVAYLADGLGCAAETPTVVRVVGDALDAAGLRVGDAIVVTNGRWRSLLCTDPACCPPEGTAHNPAGSLIGAELAYAGLPVAPSRDAAVAVLDPVDSADRAALGAEVVACTEAVVLRLTGMGPNGMAKARDGFRVEGLGLLTAAINRYRVSDDQPIAGRLTDPEAARVLVALGTDVCLRDAAYERSVSAVAAVRVAARACWTDLVRRAPAGVVAPVATVLGLLAWEDGDGFTARTAVDRALADAPEYRMALLLDTMITHCVRGDSAPALRAIRRQVAGWGRLTEETRRPERRTG